MSGNYADQLLRLFESCMFVFWYTYMNECLFLIYIYECLFLTNWYIYQCMFVIVFGKIITKALKDIGNDDDDEKKKTTK